MQTLIFLAGRYVNGLSHSCGNYFYGFNSRWHSLCSVFNRRLKDINKEGEYPEGHWMGIGISMGFLFGMPLGLLMGTVVDDLTISIGLGPTLGFGAGVAIGSVLEVKHKKEVRPLTEEEVKLYRRLTLVGLICLVMVFLVFFFLIFRG